MKPLPFIVLALYISLYVIAGFIFSAIAVVNVLVVMFLVATVIYAVIIVQEKPWAYYKPGENFLAYAIIAYGFVFFLVPIVVLNILNDLKEEGKITWKWL